jgi:hypothetical protein
MQAPSASGRNESGSAFVVFLSCLCAVFLLPLSPGVVGPPFISSSCGRFSWLRADHELRAASWL